MKLKWAVELAPAALRALRRLPRPTRINILSKVVAVAEDPYDAPQVKKLKGSPGRFRLRVGDYRVVYFLNEHERILRVERIRHRRDAYRGL